MKGEKNRKKKKEQKLFFNIYFKYYHILIDEVKKKKKERVYLRYIDFVALITVKAKSYKEVEGKREFVVILKSTTSIIEI